MLTELKLREIVESKLLGTDRFIVSLKVNPGNKIELLVDGLSNIGIQDCVALSRAVEGSLNRDEEDFELVVSSVGIEEPFLLPKQYVKNIGRNVIVKKLDGTEINALLTDYTEEGLVSLERVVRQPKKIGKGKENIIEKLIIPSNQIKETKLVLSFK